MADQRKSERCVRRTHSALSVDMDGRFRRYTEAGDNRRELISRLERAVFVDQMHPLQMLWRPGRALPARSLVSSLP